MSDDNAGVPYGSYRRSDFYNGKRISKSADLSNQIALTLPVVVNPQPPVTTVGDLINDQ